MSYLLALDQGTTSSRAIIFNEQGKVQATAQRETHISYPTIRLGRTGCTGNLEPHKLPLCSRPWPLPGILAKDIKAIGLTNQRETTVRLG